jgi:hypothetical protein
MDEIISYKPCAVKVRNAKLRNYLKIIKIITLNFSKLNIEFETICKTIATM